MQIPHAPMPRPFWSAAVKAAHDRPVVASLRFCRSFYTCIGTARSARVGNAQGQGPSGGTCTCTCACTCACRLLPASPASPRTPAPSLMVVVVPARAQHAYDMASRREFVRFGGHTSATTRLCALCEKFIFIRLSSYVYICVVKRCVRLEKKEQSRALPAGRSAHTAAGATRARTCTCASLARQCRVIQWRENCTVEGRGLTAATVRTAATFVIHAFDNQGLERKVGGDAFFVSIHGRGVRVRARVVDEQDGSYTVRYLCTQSGTYWINISLYGETLPGSPFMCQASRQTAMAPNCKVTGAALTTAIARVQQVFEIQFRDMHDDVAHAEELDVYVEPILKHEPSHEEIRDETAGEDALGPDLSSGVDAMAAANPPPGDSVGSISAAAGKRPGSPNVTRSGEASPGRPASSPKVRSTSPGASQPASPSLRPSSPPSIVDTMVDAAAGLAKALGMSEASSAPEPLSSDQQRGSAHEGTNDPSVGGSLKTNHRSSEPSKPNPFLKSKPPVVPKLQLTECVVTSKSPLIIRAGIEMESARIGQLRPGRKVNVLQIVEPQDPNSGESARACIMLDDEEEPHRAEHEAVKQQSWREAYPERPGWWDDMGLGSPRSPRSYRQQVPLGWVTLAKEGRKLVTPRTHLAAGARQQHIQAWARRKAVDSSLAATALQKNKPKGDEHVGRDAVGQRRKKPVVSVGKQDNGLFINELKSDPNGIGFAYGGVEPGRLHAHGQPVQTHKVYYSIAICGEYKLHVGLRQQEIPVPGSPFTLTVLAGQAHSLSTTLPSSMLPLRGVVGFGEGQGCRHTLQVMDKWATNALPVEQRLNAFRTAVRSRPSAPITEMAPTCSNGTRTMPALSRHL